jgi:hypothetical protein
MFAQPDRPDPERPTSTVSPERSQLINAVSLSCIGFDLPLPAKVRYQRAGQWVALDLLSGPLRLRWLISLEVQRLLILAIASYIRAVRPLACLTGAMKG